MENFSYSSYPDSGDSSPRSREIDDSQSWDELPSNYKVKFMCSYGGKIQPRPHDNQLVYVGGDTKILSVDRNSKFPVFMNKLTSMYGDTDVCFKYQLPGEDLDALISVTNDEDLEHMMLEYDRLHRASAKPARLRLFLFHLNPSGFGSNEAKSERQWFVDALNSVQMQNLEVLSPPAAVAAGNPDFLFGLDKGLSGVPAAKFTHMAPAAPTVPEVIVKEASDCGSEDRLVIGEPVVNQQIYDFQRLQIAAANEQAILSRKIEDANSRGYIGEYYTQKLPDKMVPPPQAPAAVPMPLQMPVPPAYLPEKNITSAGGYTIPAAGTLQQPVYLIPTAAGGFQATGLGPVTGQVGQGYYGVQKVAQEVYREQPVYNAVPPPQPTAVSQEQSQQLPAPKVVVYSEGIGMVHPKVGVAEQGYMQVGFDSAGRQVYLTTPYQAVAAGPAPMAAVDGRQVGGVFNQDGKIVSAANAKAAQTSSV